MAELVHTHNELRGERLASFPSIEIARARVRMDILAAENASGNAGVPKGSKPVAKTVAELGHNPYAEGTMSHRLHEEVTAQAPIQPRPKKEDLPPEQRSARVVIERVRFTGEGTSRVQAGSVRGTVLKFIQDAPGGTCSVAALEEHFQQPVRGYLQKLLEKNHIAVVTEEAS
jgi:hypothetical protein